MGIGFGLALAGENAGAGVAHGFIQANQTQSDRAYRNQQLGLWQSMNDREQSAYDQRTMDSNNQAQVGLTSAQNGGTALPDNFSFNTPAVVLPGQPKGQAEAASVQSGTWQPNAGYYPPSPGQGAPTPGAPTPAPGAPGVPSAPALTAADGSVPSAPGMLAGMATGIGNTTHGMGPGYTNPVPRGAQRGQTGLGSFSQGQAPGSGPAPTQAPGATPTAIVAAMQSGKGTFSSDDVLGTANSLLGNAKSYQNIIDSTLAQAQADGRSPADIASLGAALNQHYGAARDQALSQAQQFQGLADMTRRSEYVGQMLQHVNTGDIDGAMPYAQAIGVDQDFVNKFQGMQQQMGKDGKPTGFMVLPNMKDGAGKPMVVNNDVINNLLDPTAGTQAKLQAYNGLSTELQKNSQLAAELQARNQQSAAARTNLPLQNVEAAAQQAKQLGYTQAKAAGKNEADAQAAGQAAYGSTKMDGLNAITGISRADSTSSAAVAKNIQAIRESARKAGSDSPEYGPLIAQLNQLGDLSMGVAQARAAQSGFLGTDWHASPAGYDVVPYAPPPSAGNPNATAGPGGGVSGYTQPQLQTQAQTSYATAAPQSRIPSGAAPTGAPNMATLGKNPRFPSAVWSPQDNAWFQKSNGQVTRVEDGSGQSQAQPQSGYAQPQSGYAQPQAPAAPNFAAAGLQQDPKSGNWQNPKTGVWFSMQGGQPMAWSNAKGGWVPVQ